MRIGIIVDGQAEYSSLPHLISRIETGNHIIAPIYGDIQPLAPPGQIALAVRKKLPILSYRNIDQAIILLDREIRDECPGVLAATLNAMLEPQAIIYNFNNISVVIKNRMFENWLISDISCLEKMRKRFNITNNVKKRVSNSGADNIDALHLIKQAAIKNAYNKREDAIRILQSSDPLIMSDNSRSFRKFLKEIT